MDANSRRALVVDDEQASCDIICEVLKAAGLEPVALTRSSDAVPKLLEEKFDLVLLDFRMPSPDGLELARRLRKQGFNKQTPVILMSDDQKTTAVANAFEAGASFFLYKPIDRGRLLKLLRASR
jgi:CheY-like chemotaxis protein